LAVIADKGIYFIALLRKKNSFLYFLIYAGVVWYRNAILST